LDCSVAHRELDLYLGDSLIKPPVKVDPIIDEKRELKDWNESKTSTSTNCAQAAPKQVNCASARV
jgi:hypothetical protein